MSFLKSSTSFTRFKVLDDVKPEIYENIEDVLRKFAIMDIDDTADERAYGWTNFDDMLDLDFAASSPRKSEFIVFAFRLDTRRVAPAIIKKHVTIALRQEEEKMAELGKKYISKDRKKELTEQVKLRLRARTLPVPAVFEVIWDYSRKTIYFASVQRKVIDLFTEYFVRSFDVRIEQILPYSLAQSILGEGCEDKLDELEPTTFNID